MELKNIDLLRNEYYERMLKVTEPLNNPNIKKLIDFIFWDNAFFWSINQDDATNDLDTDSQSFSFFVKKDNIAVHFNSWGTKKELQYCEICIDRYDYWNKPKDAFIQIGLKKLSNRELEKTMKILTRFFKEGGKRKNPFLEDYMHSYYGFYHLGLAY
jgi:hypothetical protein